MYNVRKMEDTVSSLIETNNHIQLDLILSENCMDLTLITYKNISVESFQIIEKYIRKHDIGGDVIFYVLDKMIRDNRGSPISKQIHMYLVENAYDIFSSVCEYISNNSPVLMKNYMLIWDHFIMTNNYFVEKFIEYIRTKQHVIRLPLIHSFIEYRSRSVVDLCLYNNCDYVANEFMKSFLKYNNCNMKNKKTCLFYVNENVHKLFKKWNIGKVYNENHEFFIEATGADNVLFDDFIFHGKRDMLIILWMKILMKHSENPGSQISRLLKFMLGYDHRYRFEELIMNMIVSFPAILKYKEVREIFKFDSRYNLVDKLKQIKNEMKVVENIFFSDIVGLIEQKKIYKKKYIEALRFLIIDYHNDAKNANDSDNKRYILDNYIRLMDC